jgi:hypothetical protein
MAVTTRSTSAKKVVSKAVAVKVTHSSGGQCVSWDDRFNQLVVYKNEHGHANPPKREGQLGLWVANQRAIFQRTLQNGNRVLHHYQIKKLSTIGFQFCLRNKKPKMKKLLKWDDRYNQLVAYKNELGHANPLRREGQLGTWCDNQRTSFQDKMNNVSKNGLIHQYQIASVHCKAPTCRSDRTCRPGQTCQPYRICLLFRACKVCRPWRSCQTAYLRYLMLLPSNRNRIRNASDFHKIDAGLLSGEGTTNFRASFVRLDSIDCIYAPHL